MITKKRIRFVLRILTFPWTAWLLIAQPIFKNHEDDITAQQAWVLFYTCLSCIVGPVIQILWRGYVWDYPLGLFAGALEATAMWNITFCLLWLIHSQIAKPIVSLYKKLAHYWKNVPEDVEQIAKEKKKKRHFASMSDRPGVEVKIVDDPEYTKKQPTIFNK